MKFKVVASLLIIVLAIIGLLDAGYITYEKFQGVVPPCGVGFDCGRVLDSPWASIGPAPLSLLGLAFYTTFLCLGICHYLGIDTHHHLRFSLLNLLMTLASFGFAFSLYLVSLMAFVIEAWCLYCVISAMTSAALFITTFGLWSTSQTK